MFKSSGYLWATPKSLMMFSNLCLQQAYYFSLLKGAATHISRAEHLGSYALVFPTLSYKKTPAFFYVNKNQSLSDNSVWSVPLACCEDTWEPVERSMW